jgi:hypothetical protein
MDPADDGDEGDAAGRIAPTATRRVTSESRSAS